MADFDEAIDRIVAGLEKKTRVMNPKEKETVAYHEAGHALVAESRPNADRVAKVSIIPRGVAALGYTQQLPTEDRYLMTRAELLDRLDVLLGGRVAEEIVFGDVSTGAQNDLQRATDLARHMVTQYGMSETLGLVDLRGAAHRPFLNVAGAAGAASTASGRPRPSTTRSARSSALPGSGYGDADQAPRGTGRVGEAPPGEGGGRPAGPGGAPGKAPGVRTARLSPAHDELPGATRVGLPGDVPYSAEDGRRGDAENSPSGNPAIRAETP